MSFPAFVLRKTITFFMALFFFNHTVLLRLCANQTDSVHGPSLSLFRLHLLVSTLCLHSLACASSPRFSLSGLPPFFTIPPPQIPSRLPGLYFIISLILWILWKHVKTYLSSPLLSITTWYSSDFTPPPISFFPTVLIYVVSCVSGFYATTPAVTMFSFLSLALRRNIDIQCTNYSTVVCCGSISTPLTYSLTHSLTYSTYTLTVSYHKCWKTASF